MPLRTEPPANVAVNLLHQALDDAEQFPALPRVVVLTGETGRGKTFAIQRFFDDLCANRPGYWQPGLTPDWPPQSRRQVNRSRKQVQPLVADPTQAPPFFWAGVGAPAREGAAVVDMSQILVAQLSTQFSSAVDAIAFRTALAGEAAKLALDILGAFVPPLGAGRTALEHTVAIGRLRRTSELNLEKQRRSVAKAFTTVGRERKRPLIVAIDDAQNATFELLYTVSGLIASSFDVPGGDQERDFLPSILDTALPAPLLIVCTAWDHRLNGAFDDPFQVWLREITELGIDVTFQPCEELSWDESADLLDNWSSAWHDSRASLLQHLSDPADPSKAINPLVLATAIGQLEESRDLFTGEVVLTPSAIEALSNIPDQHIIDRIELLREEPPNGDRWVALLTLAARYGSAVPIRLWRLIERDLGQHDAQSLLTRLVDHGIFLKPVPSQSVNDLTPIVMDPDVYRYLDRSADARPAPPRLVGWCRELLEWLYTEYFVNDLDGIKSQAVHQVARRLTFSQALSIVLPASRLVFAASEGVTADPSYVAAAQLGEPIHRSDFPSPPPAGLAYAMKAGVWTPDDTLLAACNYFKRSTVTLSIIRRRLALSRMEPDRTKESPFIEVLVQHREHPYFASVLAQALDKARKTADAIKLLRPVLGSSDSIDVLFADLLLKDGQPDAAYYVFQRLTNTSQIATQRAAEILVDRGDIAGAIEFLSSRANLFQNTPLQLADLLIEQQRRSEAMALLQSLSSTNRAVAIKLAQLTLEEGDLDGAIDIIEPFVTWDSNAAMMLVQLHRERGSIHEALPTLLIAGARFANVAVVLAKLLDGMGQRVQALDLLNPWISSSETAATTAANLMVFDRRPGEAVKLLRPVAGRFENAALLLARLLQHSPLEEDRAEAEAMVERWLPSNRALIRLCGIYVRHGKEKRAIDLLTATPMPRSFRSKKDALILSANLMLGEVSVADAALSRAKANDYALYYAICSVLVDCRRTDLLAHLVQAFPRLWSLQRVVADFAVSLLVRESADLEALTEPSLLTRIWPSTPMRDRFGGILTKWLRCWVNGERISPPMDLLQACSCLFVAEEFNSGAGGVRAAVLRRMIERLPSEGERTFRIFAEYAWVSDVAAAAVSLADVPWAWRKDLSIPPTHVTQT